MALYLPDNGDGMNIALRIDNIGLPQFLYIIKGPVICFF